MNIYDTDVTPSTTVFIFGKIIRRKQSCFECFLRHASVTLDLYFYSVIFQDEPMSVISHTLVTTNQHIIK